MRSEAEHPEPVQTIARLLASVSTDDGARIQAALVRACGGDFQLAEDAFQDALLAALEDWPASGTPYTPAAWVMTTARRRAIDRLRREQTLARKREQLEYLLAQEQETAGLPGEQEDAGLEDDRLRLIFTCCHPALAVEAQVALTLRTVAGLSVTEIARAFLVTTATMDKRLTRARTKIRDARIPYEVPEETRLPERLESVLSVIYLVFNEGYLSSGDALVRAELCDEAVRLARLLYTLMPGEPEVGGLLALMLLNDSRRRARIDAAGDLRTLEEQDRTLWERPKIEEGLALVEIALNHHRPGPYQVQAAIAALHAEAARPEDTDWRQIALLYGQLLRLVPTPVVALNRAAAIGMAAGPVHGLRLIEDIAASGELEGYYLLPAARADLLRRAGRQEEAHAAYLTASALCTNAVEQRYLQRRLRETAG